MAKQALLVEGASQQGAEPFQVGPENLEVDCYLFFPFLVNGYLFFLFVILNTDILLLVLVFVMVLVHILTTIIYSIIRALIFGIRYLVIPPYLDSC